MEEARRSCPEKVSGKRNRNQPVIKEWREEGALWAKRAVLN